MAQKHQGFATLETSILVTVLFSIGMGAAGLISFLGEQSAINRAVDELVLADGVKPLRFSLTQESVTYSVNATALDGYLTSTLSKLQSRIGTAAPYKIELQYQVLRFNEATGAYQGVEAVPGNYLSAGSSTASATVCPEMGALLTAEAARVGGGGKPLYALPSGVFGVGFGSQNTARLRDYLPRSVLLGVRVLRDLSSTGTGQLYRLITQQALIATSCKVVFLRGDIEG